MTAWNWAIRYWVSFASVILLTGVCSFAEVPKPVAEASPGLVLRPSAVVSGSRIHLSDLIQSCSDPRLPENAKQYVLMDAPQPGGRRTLPGQWIASVIRSRKWLPETVGISVPEEVRIERAFQALPVKDLEEFFRRYIEKKIEPAEFNITQFKVKGAEKFPVGRMSFHILEPEPRPEGRVNLRLMVRVNGQELRSSQDSIRLSGWVDRYATVVCADRRLARGTILEASDLKLERMNTSRMPDGIVSDLQHAAGKRLNQTLGADRYLRQNMLSSPALIQKGDKVKLVATNGTIKIITIGIALESGGVDEQVEIENTTSNKKIVGRVVDASTVEVLF